MSFGYANLNQAILDAMDQYSAESCFQAKRGGRFRELSYRYFRRQTLRLTHFLRSRRLAGERLAIWGANSPEWMVVHMASQLAGAVVVPLRHALPRQAILALLQEASPRVVAVETAEQAAWLFDLRSELPSLDAVLTFELESTSETPGAFTLAAAAARQLEPEEVEALRQEAGEVPATAPAAIFFTSWGDGSPVGAVFTQGQRLLGWQNLRTFLPVDDDEVAYTALPWSYVPSLQLALLYFLSGVVNVLSQGRDLVFEEIQQTSPTLTLTIPNALERVYEEIVAGGIRKMPESTQEMFYWALATGKKYRQAGDGASAELRDRFERADRTFFARIRGGFGGRFRRFLCTGAPLDRNLAESIEAIGLQPINLYSVTEAGGFPIANLPNEGERRVDACGRPTPGFAIQLAADGEILVKGPTVMTEFWRRPEATREALRGGWLHTGDYGRLSDTGQIHLTGRKGDHLILSTGRKVGPARIERLLSESPFVDQAAIFGEGRPYLVALVVPDLDRLADYFHNQGEPADPAKSGITTPATSTLKWFWNADGGGETVTTTAHPRIKELLDEVIAGANAELEEWEQVRGYALVGQQLSNEATQLADDLAHNRTELSQRFAGILQGLYPQGLESSSTEIERVEVGPERLRELLEKESILDAWTADAGIEFLIDLARTQQIDAPSVVHICDTAAGVAQMEAEGIPLSTALIVGDPVRIHRVLPGSLIQLHRHEHIRRMRNRIIDLARLVDGQVLAFVVDRHGYVRGICKLSIEVPLVSDAILGPQSRLHAEISARCDALVFLVPKGGRQVRVFAEGKLAGRYTHGDWAPESAAQIQLAVEDLAVRRGYDPLLIQRLLRCAFQMSEENLGALFVLGDADAVLERSDASDISYLAWVASAPVESLSDEELINLAKQDGATVIDAATARFRGCMVLLRPGASTHAEIGPGKGARHSSAAKISAEVGALAITVSQDGPITVYDAGRRVLLL
jgi:long-chain acyl-CoA synthetase